MIQCFSPLARAVLTVVLIVLLGGLVAVTPSSVGAQGPDSAPATEAPPDSTPTPQAPLDPTRPRLRLPFLGSAGYEVTCGYGCYQHKRSMHYAVDFDLPADAPIVAAADGTVMAVTWELGLPTELNLGDALIVYIDHGNDWFTRYVHLSGITVRVGDAVQAGQIIGYGGTTGAASAHLHFELKRGESLHSPSQPIDDLFGGAPPEVGQRYVSDDVTPEAALAALPTAEPLTLPTPAPPPPLSLLPTPTLVPSELVAVPTLSARESATGPRPQVSAALVVSPTEVAFGEPVAVTFTVRNDGSGPAHFAVLGVGGREPGGRLRGGTLLFARGVTIPPGGEYRFEGSRTIAAAGELELFVFALSSDNRFLPLPVASPEIPTLAHLSVARQEHRLFLPTLSTPRSPAPSP